MHGPSEVQVNFLHILITKFILFQLARKHHKLGPTLMKIERSQREVKQGGEEFQNSKTHETLTRGPPWAWIGGR